MNYYIRIVYVIRRFYKKAVYNYEEKVNHLLVVSTPLEQKTLETLNSFESVSLSPSCLTGQRNV